METYNGLVRTPTDAIILFEACRVGILPRVQRRLSEKERQSIKSGSVFVWDEREAGMRRWTDGKSWSASRVAGSFLTYREMEGKRGGNGFDKNANRDGLSNQEADSDGGPDGYRYKPDGLMKQSFSITTSTNQHLHLISYFTRSSTTAPNMPQPSTDPHLRHIRPEKGMYPDSTVQEHNNIPAVTRGPMSSPGYTHAPNQQPPYGRGPSQPYYQQHPSWAPPSPMHTPPPHNSYQPYFSQPPYHHGGHHYSGPPPPPHAGYGAPHAYDRGPPSSGPPPPHHYSHGPPPPPTNGYAHTYPPHPPQSYNSAYSPYQPPPLQNPPYSASHSHGHESRPAAEQPRQPSSEAQEKPRSDSHQEQKRPSPKPASSDPPASTAQTIPSISAMLNGSEHGGPPARTSSRSPNGTLRAAPLQDIPSHKLGFEVNRDVQALRNLDKTTFKGY